MTETIDEKAAVDWAECPLMPWKESQIKNAARAALRWREERDEKQARIELMESWIPVERAETRALQARIAELEATVESAKRWCACGDSIEQDGACGTCFASKDSELDRVRAERDAAIKRAEEAEFRLLTAMHEFAVEISGCCQRLISKAEARHE